MFAAACETGQHAGTPMTPWWRPNLVRDGIPIRDVLVQAKQLWDDHTNKAESIETHKDVHDVREKSPFLNLPQSPRSPWIVPMRATRS